MATKKPTPKAQTAEHQVLAKLIATATHLTDAQRAAYLSLHTNEACAALGGQTVAKRVLREAVGWAVLIDQTLSRVEIVGYSRGRFAFLLEQLLALQACLDEATQQPDATADRARRDTAATALATLRDELLVRLDNLIGTQVDLRTELSEVTGAAPSTPQLLERAKALRDLLTAWLKRTGSLEILLADFQLDATTVATLEQAITRLEQGALATIGVATLGASRDAPNVNLVEGRVLHELRTVMRLFRDARSRGVNAPVLMPTQATARVLATHARKAKAAAPEAP